MPILAKGKTVTGRVWVYVRDDRPFGGPAPPAALFYASRDRTADYPELRRDNQGENSATIKMRELRELGCEGRV